MKNDVHVWLRQLIDLICKYRLDLLRLRRPVMRVPLCSALLPGYFPLRIQYPKRSVQILQLGRDIIAYPPFLQLLPILTTMQTLPRRLRHRIVFDPIIRQHSAIAMTLDRLPQDLETMPHMPDHCSVGLVSEELTLPVVLDVEPGTTAHDVDAVKLVRDFEDANEMAVGIAWEAHAGFRVAVDFGEHFGGHQEGAAVWVGC